MTEQLVVWLDGEVVPAEHARIPVLDHGVTVGDGVFETLKAVDGAPFAVRRHLARLRRSATGLGLEVPRSDVELREAIGAVLDALGAGLARIRVTVTGGPGPLGSDRGDATPTVVVVAGPLDPPAATTAAVVVPWRRNEHDVLVGLKTTSYAGNVVALARAREQGASEALFANTAGELCEGTGSNVFVGFGDRLVTPPLASGCLAGITRELVLQTTAAEERPVPMEALAEATEMFLTSTTRDVQAVHDLDGRTFDAPGPLTAQALAAFQAVASTDLDP